MSVSEGLREGLQPITRQSWRGQRCQSSEDLLVREEPLEIRVAGQALAVVMRTPGQDLDLVRGFLLSEAIFRDPEGIARVRHCDVVADSGDGAGAEAAENVVVVTPAPGSTVDLASLKRSMFASSSCGVCGKASIEQVMTRPSSNWGSAASTAERQPAITMRAAQIYELPQRMRPAQRLFEHTGALHAAALFDGEGRLLQCCEDVGRHNALDKLIGWAAQNCWTTTGLAGRCLVLSGRVSFEMVQKSIAVGIELIVAISAPSSLAVELAATAGLTLVAFVRGPSMAVYCDRGRIVGDGAAADHGSQA